MDSAAWWATFSGVAKRWTQLTDQHFMPYYFIAASPLLLDVGIIFFGGFQHSTINGCSTASSNLDAFAGEDDYTSFYFAILKQSSAIYIF